MEKVLLILESEDMQRPLRNILSEYYEVCCCAPVKIRAALAQFRPDALILDLFLPGPSGFALLESCHDLRPPVVLLLSRLVSPYILQKAQELEVGFLIQTPCTAGHIALCLGDMLRLKPYSAFSADRANVEDLLRRFRFSPKARGFSMLRTAICLTAQDPDRLLTKEIYPRITRESGCSCNAVDQAIRRLLQGGWNQREKNADLWETFFPGASRCPSNGTFIAALALDAKKDPFHKRKGQGSPEGYPL